MKSTTQMHSTGPVGLAELERRLAEDLHWLDLPAKPWVLPSAVEGEALLDVAIIGGGMAGLAAATALTHLGVAARIYDQAPQGMEGPWATIARMETLRSPKQLTGPALGLPSLTFQAWFLAQFGAADWDVLDKIPRLQWMDYLRWYRKVMHLDVCNEHRVERIVPHADHVELSLRSPAGPLTVRARHVVLATGRAGLGGPSVPAFVQHLDRRLWAHSSDVMDYGALRGLRVGVVGAGASAMDSAATALEHGAKRVDLFIRRNVIPRVNKGKGAGSAGFTLGYKDLPDDWKWRIRHYINEQQVPPPHASVLRVSRHDNAFFRVGTPVLGVTQHGDTLHLQTPEGVSEVDFLVAATGFKVDWSVRPEFNVIAPHVRLWGDRYTPAAGQEDPELAGAPDLGPGFEFQPKAGHLLPGLSRIHCLCYPATLSHGTVSGDIPAVSEGAQRVAHALVSRLFSEQIDRHYDAIRAYAEPELLGDEWTPAPRGASHRSTQENDA
ncbi:MAG TPA: NAD(P)/FAD-dependent oxidoreductase [Castellaniella sp.]|uniref:NAD(P)/FAD-dependent oxidoreductase n=1 Tax=Castellaniella sp. TaxID=1955812 RepID=UPI002F223633